MAEQPSQTLLLGLHVQFAGQEGEVALLEAVDVSEVVEAVEAAGVVVVGVVAV